MSSEHTDRRRGLQTVGVRLTAWGAGITFGVCLLVCVALYGGVWYSLNREVDGFLEGEVREFLGMVREHHFDLPVAEQFIHQHLGNRSRIDLTFRMLDRQGKVVLRSHRHDLIPADCTAGGLAAFGSAKAHFEMVEVADRQHPVRVCSMTAKTPDGTPLVAQASYAMDQVSSSLSMIRTVSLIALLAAVVLSVLGGRVLAQRSLRPLHHMIQTARKISAHRISERLPRSHNGDEMDRLADTLNNLLDRLDQYVRRMQQFTADASHELRSPLAVLQGNAEVVLARERSVEELRQVIESSLEQFRRLRKISDDLLLLARMDAGEDILQRESVRLDRIIEDVVDLYGPTASEQGLELSYECGDVVDVVGDGGRLRQVVANLIDNAIKYSNHPGHIEVSLAAHDGVASIRVSDVGIGIAADDLPRVFDRFFRADRARSKSRAAGAGLGLAICRSIVEGHGGHITLASRPGGGTVATVELPL